jgi:hypothetical protein
MKRKAFVAFALAMALAVALSAVPALAQVDTEVNVTGGTTTPPIIKCKWEQDTTLELEDGDPTHETAGGQFLPPGTYNGTKLVEYWAVVTDPEGVGTVTTVSVDVYHPVGPPECESSKYQVILVKVDKETVGIPAFEAAWDAGLVTWNPAVFADADEAYADIMNELTKCTAEVYMADEDLSYHQPAGDYSVHADAADSGNAWASEAGTDLWNDFTYVAVPGFEVDFTVVNYGNATVCVEKMIAGDTVFDEPAAPAPDPNPATVRNIGNTDIALTIKQDDMGFGFSGTPEDPDWNVEFDCRMGNDNANKVMYHPDEEVQLPNTLPLCNTEELDFSIHIVKSMFGPHRGIMDIGCVEIPFSGTCGD